MKKKRFQRVGTMQFIAEEQLRTNWLIEQISKTSVCVFVREREFENGNRERERERERERDEAQQLSDKGD